MSVDQSIAKQPEATTMDPTEQPDDSLEDSKTSNKENDASQRKSTDRPSRPTFFIQLVGCKVLKGQMDDKLWQQHVEEHFKSVIDMNSLVRKQIKLVFDRRHILLYPLSRDKESPSRKGPISPIFRHRIRSITHAHYSETPPYVSYLYKLTSSTHQLVCIETGDKTAAIKRLIETDAEIVTASTIPLSESKSDQVSHSDSNSASDETSASIGTKSNRTILVIELSSESEQSDESDIEIIDILPQIPFRNHVIADIDV